MNVKLKGKYRRVGAPNFIGYPAHARTGNSRGLQKSKMPAHEPCKRAPAGFRGQWHKDVLVPKKVMLVVFGGKKRMVTEAVAERVMKFDAEAALNERGLV